MAEFYSARGWEIPPLPWTNLSPPFSDGGSWQTYVRKFSALIAERSIEKLGRGLFDGACLLCSEKQPHHCHRRLVGEYLQQHWRALKVTHL